MQTTQHIVICIPEWRNEGRRTALSLLYWSRYRFKNLIYLLCNRQHWRHAKDLRSGLGTGFISRRGALPLFLEVKYWAYPIRTGAEQWPRSGLERSPNTSEHSVLSPVRRTQAERLRIPTVFLFGALVVCLCRCGEKMMQAPHWPNLGWAVAT